MKRIVVEWVGTPQELAGWPLLGDAELHRRLSHSARQLAETRYRVEPAVDRYVAVYRRVLGNGPRR